MHFAYNPTYNFYYMGEQEPRKHMFEDYLQNAPVVGFDVETISLKERIAIGMGISPRPDMAFYFPLFPTESPVTPWYLLKNPQTIKVAHNSIFDLMCLYEYEINADNIMDTNVMSRLLCNKFNGLTDLSYLHQLPTQNAGEFMKGYKAKAMVDCPQDEVARKCMYDAMATLRLYPIFLPKLDPAYLSIEMQTIPIMLEMSQRGILIDHEELDRIDEQLDVEMNSYLSLCESEGFNPGSPPQVSYILAKRGAYSVFNKLPYGKRKKSGGRSLSTAKEILERMEDPMAKVVLNYREKAYLLSHYVRPWANEERASTRYHLDAATGRPSSTDRNMQNIPGIKSTLGVNVRACLLPDSGIFTDMDFSQVELRILAYLSQDKQMLYCYDQPKYLEDGSENPEADIHQKTADFLGISRKIAKNVNFAMVYGATDQTMADTAHIPSVQRAGQLKEMWFQLYPQAGDAIRSWQWDAEHGKLVAQTLYGRNMRIPDPEEEGLSHTLNCSINYRVQGSAADILKRALIYCKGMNLVLQVHDELLVDGFIPQDAFKLLENLAPLRTPVEVRYLERWE